MNHIEHPIVTVVMPAYNAADYIEKTIQSVINQSYTAWELIVIDDCSKDSTREIVKRLAERDRRIKLIALGKNYGAPAAPRNIGVREAKGEWIAFLDADDIWHPQKLMLQMQVIGDSATEFCSTQMLDFVDDNLICFSSVPDNIKTSQITFYTQLRKFRTPTSSVIAKKYLLLKHPFNEDPEYKAREDFDCWLKIHEEIKSSIKLMYPLLYYRIIDGQISGAKWKMILKTYMVLSRYRLESGGGLGVKRFYYSLTQTLYSIYFRLIKKSL